MEKENIVKAIESLIKNMGAQESLIQKSKGSDEQINKLKILLLEVTHLATSDFLPTSTTGKFESMDSSNHYNMF